MNDPIQAIETLVNMDTPSQCPQALHACAQVLKSWYEEIGWQVEQHDLGPETGPLLEVRNCAHRDIICLDGMGPCGGFAHSPEEFLVLDSVQPCIELITQLLSALNMAN